MKLQGMLAWWIDSACSNRELDLLQTPRAEMAKKVGKNSNLSLQKSSEFQAHIYNGIGDMAKLSFIWSFDSLTIVVCVFGWFAATDGGRGLRFVGNRCYSTVAQGGSTPISSLLTHPHHPNLTKKKPALTLILEIPPEFASHTGRRKAFGA